MRLQQLQENIHKMNPEDPMNPEVAISGYGVMKLKTIEANLVRDLKELALRGERGDWESVEYILNGVFKAKLMGVTEAYNELENIRSRGGKNSRGIEKR